MQLTTACKLSCIHLCQEQAACCVYFIATVQFLVAPQIYSRYTPKQFPATQQAHQVPLEGVTLPTHLHYALIVRSIVTERRTRPYPIEWRYPNKVGPSA